MTGLISRRAMLAGAALAGAALVPAIASAGAQAATVGVNARCYVVAPTSDPVITIAGSGYAPGTPVSVADSAGRIRMMVPAGPTGAFAITAKAPEPTMARPGIARDTIRAEGADATGAATTATTVADITRFDFGDTGTKRAPGLKAFTEKTTWLFSGLPEGKTIYGHYTYDGKPTARQAFGRAQGPCGVLRARRRLYPATPHHKAYTIQVDAKKTYSRRTRPSGRLKLALSFS